MASTRPFQKVGSAPVRRSLFDLSYRKIFTCDSGQLIPVLHEEMIPGDKFIIGNEIVVRANPLVAPILHEINVYVHYFFVPYRLLWPDWEEFITGGEEGPGSKSDDLRIPKWNGSGLDERYKRYSVMDYLGFPLFSYGQTEGYKALPGNGINLFPWAAYHFIWDEYYRDENLQDSMLEEIKSIFASTAISAIPVNLYNKCSYMITGVNTDDLVTYATAAGHPNFFYRFNDVVHRRNWEKDYFTSALPWQQRGTSPSVPLTGQAQFFVDGAPATIHELMPIQAHGSGDTLYLTPDSTANLYEGVDPDGHRAIPPATTDYLVAEWSSLPIFNNLINWLNANNTIDLKDVGTFDTADLRHIVQIQKWMERNARAGVRYTEFLRAHFRVCPRDERLDRPEYIGGTKNGLLFSEVLQTSSTDSVSPQGNLAGHGITAGSGYVGKYVAKEFGIIMGILSIMPRSNYNSQGVNRQWLRNTRYDFYFPEFSHLSEQEVWLSELFAVGNSVHDQSIFGFQGAYDEYRTKMDMTAGLMRDEFDFWHQARFFGARHDPELPTDPDDMENPLLNGGFVECWPTKRNFASKTEQTWIVHFGNKLRAVRPMPYVPEPGLVDHF